LAATVTQGLDLDRPFEVGEHVRFRSLQWEVEDAGERLVTLFGREAINRGRQVRVVQGLEPIERTAPPPLVCRIGEKGWDHADWQGLHDAFRLTLAHGRGSLGTAAWGRMVLEPYQLVPLQRIEQLPEPRLLIADDVGLGKTSEAGLILSRLLQRRRADRILVLSRARPEPGRWRDELQEKFGLEFDVIEDGVDYARLRRRVPAHLNLYAALPRLIVSMYFAAQAERVAELERPGLHWDVVVVDEAPRRTRRALGQRHALLRPAQPAHHRRTGISTTGRGGRLRPLPGRRTTLPQGLHHPHHQPRHPLLGTDLRRPLGHRRHARSTPSQVGRTPDRRRVLPHARTSRPCRGAQEGGDAYRHHRLPCPPNRAAHLGNFGDRAWGISAIPIRSQGAGKGRLPALLKQRLLDALHASVRGWPTGANGEVLHTECSQRGIDLLAPEFGGVVGGHGLQPPTAAGQLLGHASGQG
jgi:hypothetical protein